MRLKADLTLLMVAMIWGVAFVVQRVIANSIGPFLFNGTRFLLAVLVLLPFSRHPLWRMDKKLLPWTALAGLLLFVASSLQQAGLQWTSAANAGFITSLYVVIIPVIMVFFMKQKITWLRWAAIACALVGVKLLSSPGALNLAPGDGFELIGSLVWALHVILVSRIANRIDLLQFSTGQYLVCGVLNMGVALFTDMSSLGGLAGGWWAVAFAGIISIGVGYTLQIFGQRYSPPHDAALILSSESVFAALSGYLLIGEGLQPIQVLGCVLILGAIVAVQLWGNTRVKPEPTPESIPDPVIPGEGPA